MSITSNPEPLPTSSWIRGCVDKSLVLCRWMMLELGRIARATWLQSRRLVVYGKTLWTRRQHSKAVNWADQELGERAFKIGVGDLAHRERIASLDEQIREATVSRKSTKSLRRERSEVIGNLAVSILVTPSVPELEGVTNAASVARQSVERHEEERRRMRSELPPQGPLERRRVFLGLVAVVVAACGSVYYLGSSNSPRQQPTTVAAGGQPVATGASSSLVSEPSSSELAEIDRAIVALKDPEPAARRAAAKTLAVHGPKATKAVKPLMDAIDDTDVDVRHLAVIALTEIGPGAALAVPVLMRAMKDKEPLLRCVVAEALGAIGPNARDAVPALEATIRDPDGLVRLSAVSALGNIGAGAADAVPAIVATFKDVELRIPALVAVGRIGPSAKSALPTIFELLKHGDQDVRETAESVFFFIGRGDVASLLRFHEQSWRENDDRWVQVEKVLDDLGPDDQEAVAPLVAAVSRTEARYWFHVVSGLGRMGPAARPAIPALTELKTHESPSVRNAAADAFAKIAAKQPVEGIPPPTFNDPPTRTNESNHKSGKAIDLVQAEKLFLDLFGPPSEKYREHGFKEVTLGVTMDEVTKKIPLSGVNRINRYIYMSGPDTGEEFVFDRDKKLVIYSKIYNGGADDHLDRIVDIFGKADPAHVRSYTIESGPDTSFRTAATYHFPKVLVRVLFNKTVNELGTRERTSVVVVSKAWGLPLLMQNYQDKNRNVEWLAKVATFTRDANPRTELFPPLENAEFKTSDIRSKGDSLRVTVLDTKYKAINDKRTRDYLPGAFATIERPTVYQLPTSRNGKPTTKIFFNFKFYSANAIEAIYQQPEPRGYLPTISNNALSFTMFAEVIPELNSLILQEAFPPKSDTIKLVRPAKGSAYHEWRTKDGWKVTSIHDDSVKLERVTDDGP